MSQIGTPFSDPEILLQILDNIEAYVYIKDLQGRYLYVNNHVCELFGYGKADIVGKDDSNFFSLEIANDLRRNDRLVMENGRVIKREEHTVVKAVGETRYYWTVKQPMKDKEGRIIGMYGISLDITKMSQLRKELSSLAQTDDLTQLTNRRYFIQMLEHTLAQSRRYNTPCSIIMFDLDHFKRVNDTYGHQAGDEVLRHIAEETRKLVREPDIEARLGGEEFCILLPQTALEGAKELAERLRQAVAQLEIKGRWDGVITPKISVGVVTMEADEGVDELLHRADNKLYEAKNSGRNRVCS